MGRIPIAPGVYSQFYDLSTYVEQLPSTIGFMCFLSDKGPDNKMVYMSSRKNFLETYGDPNYGKYLSYAEGLLTADNFMKNSPSMYMMRVMPDDATYSHIAGVYQYANATNFTGSAGQKNFGWGYMTTPSGINVNDETSIETFFATALGGGSADVNVTANPTQEIKITDGVTFNPAGTATTSSLMYQVDSGGGVMVDYLGKGHALVVFYSNARGSYYNNFKIQLTPAKNKEYVYLLDTLIVDPATGDWDVKETLQVSFRQDLTDDDGESIYIESVLDKYSNYVKCKVNELKSFDQFTDLIAADILSVTSNAQVVEVDGIIFEEGPDTTALADGKKYFFSAGAMGDAYVPANFGRVMTWDATNHVWESPVVIDNGALIHETGSDKLYIHYGAGEIGPFDPFAYPFICPVTSADNIGNRQLKYASDGGLVGSNGQVVDSVARQLLAQGYQGLIDRNVIDRDNYYFTVVFDAGYPSEVKDSIEELCKNIRRDCVGILSNGKSASDINTEIAIRRTDNTYNTFYLSLYCVGTKIYDVLTGTRKWVHPTYHMAEVIPYNDNVANLFSAPAGFNRGTINGVEEMRYNPVFIEDLEQLYLNQLNPLVLSDGTHLVYGEMTTQRRASAMQSLKIVRTVLYIDSVLRKYCKYYLWEQNDDITWNQVQRDIVQFLEDVKTQRGLYSYSVSVGATEYERKRKMFHVDITLEPTRAVEKILLNFFIK